MLHPCELVGINRTVPLSQLGVRTEGIQEALLKKPAAATATNRMNRMRHVLKAVSPSENVQIPIPKNINMGEISLKSLSHSLLTGKQHQAKNHWPPCT